MASNGLVRLLEGMARLPQAPRRDLASLLRQWLLHVTSLLDQRPRMVFDTKAISSRNVDRLLDWVISGNTQTAGTVEQRLIDGLAAILHPEEAGWRGRGFGDAVYVSNLSRRKVGDCEFQNTPTRTVAGYEPHGGRLTGHYRDGHLKSLRRVIDLRIDEWSRVADIHEWVVDVHFVAHEIDRTFSPSKEEMSSGPTVIISAATFRQFIDRVRSHVEPRQLNDAMVHFVFSALNEPQIGQWIRDSASINCSLELISESSEPD